MTTAAASGTRPRSRPPKTGRRTYTYAITHAVPLLLSSGCTLPKIWHFLVDNPRR